MNRLICAFFLMIVASGAAARDIAVRSGEHDEFTRLVLQVPQGTDWVLTQTKEGARLSVALDEVEFETGAVFRRLTQNRLTAISQGGPGAPLEMQFGCDCAASAFLYQDTMIVVDIAKTQALPPISMDIPLPVLPVPDRNIGSLADAQNRDVLPMPVLPSPLRGFEERLSARLIQGADRGIVDLDLAQVGPRASIPERTYVESADPMKNINVSSVLDGLSDLLGPNLIATEREPVCITDAELGFENWAGADPFTRQVAGLRAGLYLEFDRINQKTARDLAKLYAYFGFGSEALQALTLLDTHDDEANRISVIAQYLDTGHAMDANPFAGLQHCDGAVALWAVLTTGNLPENTNLDRVEQAFSRLPSHLRRQLGPALSDILVDGNRLEAARRVLRSVDRTEAEPSAGTTQAKAKVASAEGDVPKAETLLNEVIAAPGPDTEAPLALARLIEKRWTGRGAVSPDEVELAASYAHEFRKSDIAPLLLRSQAVALSLTQEFDLALDTVAAIPTGAERSAALNRVALILVERADDATFSRRALNMSPSDSGDLSTQTAVAMATRLAALGFSGPALALSSRPQDTLQRSQRARIRARSALQTHRPHQALLELEQDDSDEALRIKQQVMQALDAFEVAGEISRVLGQMEEADRLFWLADRPDAIDDEAETQYGLVSHATQFLATPPTRQPDKPLAEAAGLLQDSADTRLRISEMLSILQQQSASLGPSGTQ